jgi:hypothetical protein
LRLVLSANFRSWFVPLISLFSAFRLPSTFEPTRCTEGQVRGSKWILTMAQRY